MPKLQCLHNENFFLKVKLIESDMGAPGDGMKNRVSLKFEFIVNNEKYAFRPGISKIFSPYGLKEVIYFGERIIEIKRTGKIIQPYALLNHDGYFELILSDSWDNDRFEVELWLNMDYIEGDLASGYHKGFQFNTPLDSMESFVSELKSQFRHILKDSYENVEIENISRKFENYRSKIDEDNKIREDKREGLPIIKKMLNDKLPYYKITKYTGIPEGSLKEIAKDPRWPDNIFMP